MVRAGYSPSVRLFEAAACGTPIISDNWPGLEDIFAPGEEILIARDGAESLSYLREIPQHRRRRIGLAARRRVLTAHTATHRAAELELYVRQAGRGRTRKDTDPSHRRTRKSTDPGKPESATNADPLTWNTTHRA